MMKVKIPRDQLALSILSANAVHDGEDFREDGYVYKHGKRLRKWFTPSSQDSKYFWTPCLKDIPRIERLFRRLELQGSTQWAELEALFKKIQAKGSPDRNGYWKVHVKPTHQSVEDSADWWVMKLSSVDGQLSYGHDWITRPRTTLSPALGKAFYKASERSRQIYYRLGRVRNWLFDAICKDIRAKSLTDRKSAMFCRTFQYTINGRVYLIREEWTRWGGKELAWQVVDDGHLIMETL